MYNVKVALLATFGFSFARLSFSGLHGYVPPHHICRPNAASDVEITATDEKPHVPSRKSPTCLTRLQQNTLLPLHRACNKIVSSVSSAPLRNSDSTSLSSAGTSFAVTPSTAPQLTSTKTTEAKTTWNRIPRGGSLARHTSDGNDTSFLVKKMRNLVRSVLHLSSPTVAQVFQSFIRVLEVVTRVSLLPVKSRVTEVVTRGGGGDSSDKKKRRKKSKSKNSSLSNSDEEQTVEGESQTKTSPEHKKKRRKKTSKKGSNNAKGPTKTTKATKTVSKTKVKTSSKKASSITIPSKPIANNQHLTKSLHASNPNHRIQRELKEFLQAPPPNLRVSVGKNIRVWIVTLTGAKNTIYEGEVYRLRVAFPPKYPIVPPSVYFLKPTPRHEHVYTNGDICLSLLGKDWRPTMTAQSIAVSILSILSSARKKSMPMDNSRVAGMKPGMPQDNWVYHDDNC